MNPLLTIVTISFNQAKYLAECIRSTDNFLNGEIQHLVIDAGSSDGSRQMLTKLRSNRSNLEMIFEPDNGPADGLNKGLAIAKGEWVCFLNSDDFFLDKGLARLTNILRKSENFDFVYGHGLKFQGDKIETKIVSNFSELFFISNNLKMFQQSSAFRKSFLVEKKLNFNTLNSTCWDLEFYLDVVKSGSRNRKVNEFFGGFRIHNESISGSGRLEILYNNDVSALKKESVVKIGAMFKILITFIAHTQQIYTRIRFFRKIRRVRNENSYSSR